MDSGNKGKTAVKKVVGGDKCREKEKNGKIRKEILQ